MKLAGAYINDETYERLVALAAANNRTLAGQCRHLFDRALKGQLQVQDAPAAAGKPALRALARALKSLEARPLPEAAAARTAGMAQPVAPPPRARPDNETFPRAGRGVAAVGPVATGFAATPKPPAAGHARCTGRGACCGSHRDARFFDTKPMTTPSTRHPCLCHTLPHPLPPGAPEDPSEPPTAARRTAR